MDLLDRLLGHDVWTTRQLLLQAQSLSPAQLDQQFAIDQRSLRECFEHIIENMEIWCDLMAERPVRDLTDNSIEALLQRLSNAGRDFAAIARTISREQRWDAVYADVLDEPPVQKTYGGTIGHLITHSMHHRAQIMLMLEQLGCQEHIEGDLLSWEAQAFGWKSHDR
ncbi:DinB family protein [Herpetosiphon gulosus]|uniref:DinB-like domain-containing protein n=1 Tax=Herpetosiphon gulosus TaxID=1973496 RepID=A0ABP9WWE3_9CHLR